MLVSSLCALHQTRVFSHLSSTHIFGIFLRKILKRKMKFKSNHLQRKSFVMFTVKFSLCFLMWWQIRYIHRCAEPIYQSFLYLSFCKIFFLQHYTTSAPMIHENIVDVVIGDFHVTSADISIKYQSFSPHVNINITETISLNVFYSYCLS